MGKNVYITNLSSFLPNEPVENDAMEDVLGYIGGHSSRIKRIILSQNQIKQRYYAIKNGNYTHTNAYGYEIPVSLADGEKWQMPLQVYLMINLQLMMFNFYHVELLRLTK